MKTFKKKTSMKVLDTCSIKTQKEVQTSDPNCSDNVKSFGHCFLYGFPKQIDTKGDFSIRPSSFRVTAWPLARQIFESDNNDWAKGQGSPGTHFF